MNFLRQKLGSSPVLARVVPFIAFIVLTALQDKFGEEARYWNYVAKTGLAVLLLWVAKPFVPEMKWAFSWEALLVGIAVFAMWVGTDSFFPHWGVSGKAWNPFVQFAGNDGKAWFFVVARITGMTLVVPVLEEVFYRSFVYRWIVEKDFERVPFNRFDVKALLATAVAFGFTHNHWLAGILCGLAYQWLVLRKNRIGDAITAHAITNLLLGIWVVWRGAWQFF